MASNDFSSKKALLIEDMAEARILQKKMLNDFGFETVDIALKAESAIDMLKAHSYDVVLSDYNLGSGKDGQQLLEEIRHSRLVPNTACYLMVTAETSIEMVMGAIEYQPDGYISKPFSQAMLQRRLGKLLETKAKLHKVNAALDKKDYETAIEEAQKAMKTYPFLEGKCQRTIGDCLLDLKEFEKAEAHFQSCLDERKMPWAMFGLAKAQYFQGRYEDAAKKFKQLMLDNRFFVNAYDWLARCLVDQGNELAAQDVLIDGVSKSPKGILRQIELGNLSIKIEDWKTAEMSFRRAVFLAKHSCYNSPDIYLGHLQSIVGMASEGDLPPRQLDNFHNSLKKLLLNFPEQPSLKGQSYEQEIELYLALNDTKTAKQVLQNWNQDIEIGIAMAPNASVQQRINSELGE